MFGWSQVWKGEIEISSVGGSTLFQIASNWAAIDYAADLRLVSPNGRSDLSISEAITQEILVAVKTLDRPADPDVGFVGLVGDLHAFFPEDSGLQVDVSDDRAKLWRNLRV